MDSRWKQGLMKDDKEIEEEVLFLLEVRPLSYRTLRRHMFHLGRLRRVLESLEVRELVRPGIGGLIVLTRKGKLYVSELLR